MSDCLWPPLPVLWPPSPVLWPPLPVLWPPSPVLWLPLPVLWPPSPVLWPPLPVFVTNTYYSNLMHLYKRYPLLWDETLFSQVHRCMPAQTSSEMRPYSVKSIGVWLHKPLLWDETLFSQLHWCMTAQTSSKMRPYSVKSIGVWLHKPLLRWDLIQSSPSVYDCTNLFLVVKRRYMSVFVSSCFLSGTSQCWLRWLALRALDREN